MQLKLPIFIMVIMVGAIGLAGCQAGQQATRSGQGISNQAGVSDSALDGSLDQEVIEPAELAPITDTSQDDELLEALAEIDTMLGQGVPNESDLDDIE